MRWSLLASALSVTFHVAEFTVITWISNGVGAAASSACEKGGRGVCKCTEKQVWTLSSIKAPLQDGTCKRDTIDNNHWEHCLFNKDRLAVRLACKRTYILIMQGWIFSSDMNRNSSYRPLKRDLGMFISLLHALYCMIWCVLRLKVWFLHDWVLKVYVETLGQLRQCSQGRS